MIKKTFVRTRSLQDGMRIEQSIKDKTGRVLIHRGTLLDEYMINSMLKMNIAGVYIGEGEEDPEPEEKDDEPKISPKAMETIEKNMTADRSKVQLTESVKKRVEEGIPNPRSLPALPTVSLTT